MRPCWEIKTIGEVCEIRSGRNQKEVENPSGQYPIYGSGGIMGYADDHLCEAGATIIGRKGSINNPIFVETKFWNVDTAFGFSPKETILPKFLFYFCKGFNFQSMNKGTTIPSLVKTDLLQIRIPVPSIQEQQRIVDILDREFSKIDALKANAEKSLQAAKDLFQATLKKELEPKEGWKKKRIGDLCEIYNGGTPSTNIDKYWDGGIQWITPKDMGKSKEMYVSLCERTISQEGVEHSSTKILPVRSVIVSSRAPIGYVAINNVPMATNQGCKGFVLGEELYPEFLYYFLLASTELLNKLGTGATFKEVSGKKLAEIALDYPDIEIQQEIAKHILSLSHRCSILQKNYQKTLSLCDDLKQAILRKAFNGEL